MADDSDTPTTPPTDPPLVQAESSETPPVIVKKRRLPGFDKLLEPVRRLFLNDDPGAVQAAGTVQRKKYREPRVLFVCTGNAARSQMAEAFARQNGLYAESAGTWPAPSVPHEVVDAMQEKGFDLSGVRPQLLDPQRLGAFDRVVLFEVKLQESWKEGARIEEWNDIWDPTGLPLEGHRLVAAEIEKRVGRLAKLLKGNAEKRAAKKAAAPVA